MEWILLSERQPEIAQEVLVFRDAAVGPFYNGIYIATYYQEGKGVYQFYIDCFVGHLDDSYKHEHRRPVAEFSHWMPLPEEPELK